MKSTPIDVQAFFEEVYSVVSEIPRGTVISYGEIALLLNKPGYSRLVGRALKNVPDGLSLPCQRVVNSQGRIAPGWPEQRLLLEEEGVQFRSNGEVDMKRFRWDWQNS